MAKAIDREDNWARLGQQALKQGNHKVGSSIHSRLDRSER
jgi:coatomer subunit alpha